MPFQKNGIVANGFLSSVNYLHTVCNNLLRKMEEIKTKRCPKCERFLPITEFNKSKSRKDGLQCYCKECQKAMQAEYRQANKDAIRKQKAEYYAEYYNPQKNPLGWAKRMVNGYIRMDRERGFDDSKTITAEWFLKNIAYKPCAHCGKQGIGLIGCNRLDNTKGHTIDNVESCCFKCNCKDNIRDQLERGIHISCKHKKQSFSDFVNAHKVKDKPLQ